MDTFGDAYVGYPSYLKAHTQCDYVEPTVNDPIGVNPFKTRPPPEPTMPQGIDCYLLHCDGYAHDSYERMTQQRIKHWRKPVGPLDVYRRPVSTAMDMGWWSKDPALEGSKGDWTKMTPKYPSRLSDITKYIDLILKKDKQFFM